ncbi:hypothetical protein ACHAP4_010010 [Fusarium culmorum]|uniref:Uncharacterized protein n=1 Tax=Fusarium culmorum TaxID=5516 RepID=A0A2T4GPC0_FUSCU|nr:hypothetical protein FCULG_00000173 [Fusarium culmorum]
MLSSNVIRALALFIAAANASPCRPTTTAPGIIIEVTSTATVIESTTDISSTIVESATEAETTDIPTTTVVIIGEPTTTTAAGTGGPECSSSEDCFFGGPSFCMDGLLNVCVCLNNRCIGLN